MERMNTTNALGWFLGGVMWFLLLTALAIWAPWSSKVTPLETPQKFFPAIQYAILYPKRGPKFDPQHPNPTFKLSQHQKDQLKSWGLNDCVQTDGTADQATDFLSGACFCENAPAVRAIFEPGFAVQPANTLSTLSLSIVGLLILASLVFSDLPPRANFMTVTYFFALGYAGLTISLGPLSMMLHLGLRDLGGWFDSLSLYLWFGFVACYAFFRFIVACMGNMPDNCPSWPRALFAGAWLACVAIPAVSTFPGVGGDPTLWYLILGLSALAGEFLLWIGNLARSHGDQRFAPATSWRSGADHWWSNLPWDTGGRTWFLAGGITFALSF